MLIEHYAILMRYSKNDVELNFRSDGIAVPLTALQLQWEFATRMTSVNEMRPFRHYTRTWYTRGCGARMNINISASKNKNLRLIVGIGLTAKGLECNCKLYSFMNVDCRLKQENADRVTVNSNVDCN